MFELNKLVGRRSSQKAKNIVGRGESSGKGKTSGRGHKGAKSRSGYSRKLGHIGGAQPLHLISPVVRGRQKNPTSKHKPTTLSFKMINSVFREGEEVSVATLQKKGISKFDKGFRVVGGDPLEVQVKSVIARGVSRGARCVLEDKGIEVDIIDF